MEVTTDGRQTFPRASSCLVVTSCGLTAAAAPSQADQSTSLQLPSNTISHLFATRQLSATKRLPYFKVRIISCANKEPSPSKQHTSHKDDLKMASDPEREHALEEYKKTLLDSREWEAKLKSLRLDIKGLQHDYDVSEDNIKALQSVGQIIGEVLKQLDEERCKLHMVHLVSSMR
jgi:hypothetical protein